MHVGDKGGTYKGKRESGRNQEERVRERREGALMHKSISGRNLHPSFIPGSVILFTSEPSPFPEGATQRKFSVFCLSNQKWKNSYFHDTEFSLRSPLQKGARLIHEGSLFILLWTCSTSVLADYLICVGS